MYSSSCASLPTSPRPSHACCALQSLHCLAQGLHQELKGAGCPACCSHVVRRVGFLGVVLEGDGCLQETQCRVQEGDCRACVPSNWGGLAPGRGCPLAWDRHWEARLRSCQSRGLGLSCQCVVWGPVEPRVCCGAFLLVSQ